MGSQSFANSPKQGCIYVEIPDTAVLSDLCEEVYRAFSSFLSKGLRRVRVYVKSRKASDWIKVCSCVLTRNLVVTVEVYASENINEELPARECAELLEVPVAPPTSLVRECRQVIPRVN